MSPLPYLRGWMAVVLAALGLVATGRFVSTQAMFAPLPLETPAPPDNATTTARAELGRLLFWDPVLSGGRDVACATCHHPDHGYTDGRDVSIGVGGLGLGEDRRFREIDHVPFVKRNSQTVLNTAFNGWTDTRPIPPGSAPMFWDSRVRGLEAQALAPIDAFEEMRGTEIDASAAVAAAVARLSAIEEYSILFRDAFGTLDAVTTSNLARAIAAFERTLTTPQSPFDRYLRGEQSAMRPEQLRGMQQFTAAGCQQCHSGPMLSDFKVHTLGTPHNPRLAEPDKGVGGSYGFRTPTLRNLAFTAPYMHNGVFRTLDEVLAFYLDIHTDRPGRARHPQVTDAMLAPLLFEGDPASNRADIPAFLDALNDAGFDRRIPNRVPSGLPVGGAIGSPSEHGASPPR